LVVRKVVIDLRWEHFLCTRVPEIELIAIQQRGMNNPILVPLWRDVFALFWCLMDQNLPICPCMAGQRISSV
jgi:hypothetical protein